jgi:hypothetical protein
VPRLRMRGSCTNASSSLHRLVASARDQAPERAALRNSLSRSLSK